MRNPTYEGGFQPDPMPERIANMFFVPVGERKPDSDPNAPHVILSVGIKTTVTTRGGQKIQPIKEVVFEIHQGDEIASFPVSSWNARALAARMIEFADSLEGKT